MAARVGRAALVGAGNRRTLAHHDCRDGKRDKSFRIEDSAAMARVVGTLALGAMMKAKIHNDPETLRSLAPQVLGLLGAAVSV